ncbi:uncharacterized protein N7458_004059 [Penicillium daleae]|uniref:Uncharacterized protein n=1 Tax=Penicillium daleae TaxID=63821 RepID=A0AAD6CC27_9EURO|nr:uncharacterized protein N7458_004059 [Penicillium daleae]KAJ5455795.1 hypothetical protein N7458_004059 [Penicillium daleae]
MRISPPSDFLNLSVGLVMAMFAVGGAALPHAARATTSSCSRACMTAIITDVLDSMVAHDPLLAIDAAQGTGYFALDVNEGNDDVQTILRGRIAVVDQKITELELFLNRNRGDHGFSFNATQLVPNYRTLMMPPANRTKNSRKTLETVSEALFATSSETVVTVDDNCQFTELGWKVVDTGVYGNGTTDPLGCNWPDSHPTDDNARVNLVIDEELGFIVTSGIIPGKVYPYNGNVSAFIPNRMTDAQAAQDVWFAEMKAKATLPVLSPMNATGDTLEVLQYYNGKLQAMQINVFMNGPSMTSAWL